MNPSSVDDALMEQLQEWLALRLSQGYGYLKSPRSVTHLVHHNAGPHWLYGQVSLDAVSAATFTFKSQVKWPEPENWDNFVLPGVLDVLRLEEHRLSKRGLGIRQFVKCIIAC